MLPIFDVKLAGRPYLLNILSVSRVVEADASEGRYAVHFIGEDEPLFIDGDDFSKIRNAVAMFNRRYNAKGDEGSQAL